MAVFVSLDGIVVEVLDVFSSFNGDSEFFLCKRLKDKSQFVMERSQFEEMFQLQSSRLTTQENYNCLPPCLLDVMMFMLRILSMNKEKFSIFLPMIMVGSSCHLKNGVSRH
ncbi:hypothetical protein AMCSP13_000664 [Streptococcus pneumoniae 2070335]|nr:hypothetical protein AMCSP13_000664 [Streptococcus pneumoniae 2070335]